MTNYSEMKASELKSIAKEMKVSNWWNLKKSDLITEIEKLQPSLTPDVEETLTPKRTNQERFIEHYKGMTLKQLKASMKEMIEEGISFGEEYDYLNKEIEFGKLKAVDEMLPVKTTNKSKPAKDKHISNEPATTDNLITLKELMGNMSGKKARRILRNAKIDKPSKQWAWDKTDTKLIQKIKDLLK